MARMRLARYVAKAGIASRRKAEDLIRTGQVRVNGKVVTDVATNVDETADSVTVAGEAAHPEDLFYAVLNKPKACLTTVSDPWNRPTVMDYLPRLPVRVKPVGRLDFYSEGVLLVTNDGDLAAALLAPRSKIEKTYHVKVRGQISDRHLEALRQGVRIGPHTRTREAQVDRLKTPSKHDWLVVTLTQGKSRQIHRMLEALGYTVTKLQRVAFAGLTFHGLRVGDARELTQNEVNELRALAGVPKNPQAVGRGKWKARREDSERGRRARALERAEKAEKAPDERDARSSGASGTSGTGRRPASKPGSRGAGRAAARTGASQGGQRRSGAPPRTGPSKGGKARSSAASRGRGGGRGRR